MKNIEVKSFYIKETLNLYKFFRIILSDIRLEFFYPIYARINGQSR